MNLENYKKEYILALKNEVSIDESVYFIHGVEASEYSFAPRPQTWLHKYKKYKGVKHFMSVLKFMMFLCGGVFFLIDLIKSWKLFVNRKSDLRIESVAVAFSELSYKIIESNQKLVSSKQCGWIHFPWNNHKRVTSHSDINIYNLLSKLEALRIFYYSFYILYGEGLKCKGKYFLQYYTVMRWLLVRHALSKINADMYMSTEHFDRWAILLDCCIKSKSVNGNKIRHIIFQHGILKQIDQDGKKYVGDFQFRLPSKLEMVTDIFAYDHDSISVFREYIISDIVSEAINYHVMPLQTFIVQKSNLANPQGMAVLFVGHPMCLEQQKKIYNELSKETLVYYKPHPTTKITSDILRVGWQVINEKDYFPEVDFLISYPSTLVREYQGIGVDAIVHPLNADSIELSECISSVLKRIDNDKK